MAEHLTEFQRLQRKATSSFEAIRDLANNDERAFTSAFRSFQSLWMYQQEHRCGCGLMPPLSHHGLCTVACSGGGGTSVGMVFHKISSIELVKWENMCLKALHGCW